MEIYQITFDGNRIDQAPGVKLHNYEFNNLPERDINIHKLARRSLSIITSSEYSQKIIPIYLDVCAGSRIDTEAAIINLKSLIQAQNGTLIVLQGNLEVQYTATMNEFNIEWLGSTAIVTIVFLASTPIGTSVDAISLFNANSITSSTYNQTFLIEGSFAAEPVITVIINSVTGGTGATINLFNAINNQGISITEDFTSGSVLEVDSENMTVTLDGANLDFQGLFPTFAPGTQQIGYTDTFTTRNIDISSTYRRRLI